MIKLSVEVHSVDVQVKSGTSARTGRDYSIREQTGYVRIGDVPYPEKVKLMLDKDEPPYQPGHYSLNTDSFYVGNFGDLQVRARLDRASRKNLGADLKAAI